MAGECGEGAEDADEGVGFESSVCCRLFEAGTGFDLPTDAKTCGRHLARCFAVGALASSSERYTLANGMKGLVSKSLHFRQRSSRASIAISRAGGFIRIK